MIRCVTNLNWIWKYWDINNCWNGCDKNFDNASEVDLKIFITKQDIYLGSSDLFCYQFVKSTMSIKKFLFWLFNKNI